MAAQSLGTLTIDLQAQTATLQSDLGKAARLTEQAAQQMSVSGIAAGVAIGNALTAAFEKLPELIGGSLEQFDNFSKASQKVGVSTEEFSKLAYAAGLSDVSVEDLTTTVVKLDKNLEAAQSGNKAMQNSLAALGITAKDPLGALNQISDLFHDLPDGADKTAIAVALLGKSGANAIPLLNGGSAALKDLGDEAAAFGLVVSTQAGQQAEIFNDDLKKLEGAAGGFRNELTAQLLPALTGLSQQFVDAAKQGDGLNTFADGLSTVFLAVAKGAAYAVDGIKEISQSFAQLVSGVANLTPKLKEAMDTGGIFKAAGVEAQALYKGLTTQDTAYTDSIEADHKQLAQTLAALDSKTVTPKAETGPSAADAASAAAKVKAYQDAAAKQKAADEAEAAAKKALNALIREQADLEQRELTVKLAMTAGVAKATDQLYKSDIPGLDAYNTALAETNKQVADFTKSDTNKITGVISPADTASIAAYKTQMDALAKSTLTAATAKNDLDQQTQTRDLQAEASDAISASKGVAALAVENNNYAKSLQAAATAFENNTADDATELFQKQTAAIQTMHDLAIKNLKDQNDTSVQFIKDGANGLQDLIANALDGQSTHKGIKGFLTDFTTMLDQAAAKAAAANIMQYLFGNTGKTGDVGGLFGSLFSNSSTSSAAASSAGWSGAGVFGGAGGASISSSSGIGSWLSGLFSGKASGGAVTAGTGYLVGENGPEFFSPSMNGTITPNHALGGPSRMGSSVINVTVQPTSTRRTADQVATAIATKQRIATTRNS